MVVCCTALGRILTPQGGVGTVYVNGVKKGTINFYSANVMGIKLQFKFGTQIGYNVITVTSTGKGKKGGYDMYLDAGVEDISD